MSAIHRKVRGGSSAFAAALAVLTLFVIWPRQVFVAHPEKRDRRSVLKLLFSNGNSPHAVPRTTVGSLRRYGNVARFTNQCGDNIKLRT